MLTQEIKKSRLPLRRRDFGVLTFGAVALLATSAAAQGVLDSLKGDMERLKNELEGNLSDLKGDVREEAAYLLGMESYVYGYPMVIMDVTRQVMTAAPAPNSEGTAAPINQLAKMPHYVSPYFTNVVRISLNSLWTTGFVDLANEPIVLSAPDTKGRYYVFSVMNMWTMFLCLSADGDFVFVALCHCDVLLKKRAVRGSFTAF